MTGGLTCVLSTVLLLLTTGVARCANRVVTAPRRRSAGYVDEFRGRGMHGLAVHILPKTPRLQDVDLIH